jgi:puromycin-sensitive aminopeptidase
LLFSEETVDNLGRLLGYTDYSDLYKKYCLNLFSTIYQKLGWDAKESENPLDAMLRAIALDAVGTSEDQAVIDEARKRFKRHINGDLIDPNIRLAVYGIVSLYGDEDTLKEFRKLYKETDVMEEQNRLLSAMGYSLNTKIIEDTLDFIFQGVCLIFKFFSFIHLECFYVG